MQQVAMTRTHADTAHMRIKKRLEFSLTANACAGFYSPRAVRSAVQTRDLRCVTLLARVSVFYFEKYWRVVELVPQMNLDDGLSILKEEREKMATARSQ